MHLSLWSNTILFEKVKKIESTESRIHFSRLHVKPLGQYYFELNILKAAIFP